MGEVIDGFGRLIMKSSWSLCVQNRFIQSSSVMSWCKWVPIKVNLLAWRAWHGRLPTMENLVKKGIRVDSLLCPLCKECLESACHLFSSCFVAAMIWHGVSSWCGIQQFFAFETNDLLELFKFAGGCSKKKEVIKAIVMFGLWSIWKARNEEVFNNKRCLFQKVFKELKSLSFIWVKHRADWRLLTWEDLCNFSF
ncbi:hypothetical protein R6Q59_007995 [Mikania micrantha]